MSKIFPELLEFYLKEISRKNYARNKNIIEKRFGLNGSKKYTLEEIGLYHDLTKERIRQVQFKVIDEIQLLLEGRLNTKKWTISKNLEDECKRINTERLSLGCIISEQRLKHYFPNFSLGYFNLFMNVLGYTKIPDSSIEFRGTIQSGWYQNKIYNKQNIQSIFSALNFIFDNPIKTPIFDVIVALKRRTKKALPTNDVVNELLPMINEIEVSNDNIQVKFNKLSNVNRTFRLLYENNESMHFREIVKIINSNGKNHHSKILKGGNLVNQLILDKHKRFTSIGKSGQWALSEWDSANNITIIEAIRIVLHKNGKPMHFDNILEDVLDLRSASKNTLNVYLHDPKLFTRVDTKTFALTEWKLPLLPKSKVRKITPNHEFNNVLKSAFSNQKLITFPNLISIISEKTNMSGARARQRLLFTKGIKISPVKGKRHHEVFCSDINLIESPKHQKKIYLRDTVQAEIKSILSANPNTPIKKGELYKKVSKNIDCLRPTFYQYLSIINDSNIRKYKEGNSYYVVYSKNKSN